MTDHYDRRYKFGKALPIRSRFLGYSPTHNCDPFVGFDGLLRYRHLTEPLLTSSIDFPT